MNEFDDLFEKKDKQIDKESDLFDKAFNERDKKNMDSFNKDIQYQRKNGILFLIYIVVNVLFTFGGLMYFSTVYPDSDNIVDNLTFVLEPEFTIDSEGDYPTIIDFHTEIMNDNSIKLQHVFISLDLYDVNDDYYMTFDYYFDDIGANETITIQETLDTHIEPFSYDLYYEVDLSPMFYVVLGFLQAFVAGIIFLIVDKLSFKKDWTDFRRSPGKYIGQIFVGFFIVFGALLVSSMILELLNVSDTSQNEATIRGFFEKDTLRLVLLFFMLCIFTPIVEEVIFRKVVYNFIEPRTNSLVAIIGTGVVFGLMHVITYGDFIQSIPYILMGITFGYIYYRSRKNLIVTIGVHFLNNFVSYLMYVLVLYGYYTI